jgi:small-conductance mechanosensitive channel
MDPTEIGDVAVNPTVFTVLWILVVLVGAYVSTGALGFIFDHISNRFPARRLFFKRLQPLCQITIYSLSGYLVVKIISPEPTSMYAILGSMALAFGLAAQDLLKDLLGGIVVLIDRPFQVGDRINVDGQYGEVTSIGLRSTKMVTPEDSLVTVPNSTILSANISNTNAGAIDCQVVVSIYLPVYLNLRLLETIAREAVLTSKEAHLQKPFIVDVRDEFREAHMTLLKVRAYVFDTRYEESFATDLTARIKKELVDRGMLPPGVQPHVHRLGDEIVAQIDKIYQHNRLAFADSLVALGTELESKM